MTTRAYLIIVAAFCLEVEFLRVVSQLSEAHRERKYYRVSNKCDRVLKLPLGNFARPFGEGEVTMHLETLAMFADDQVGEYFSEHLLRASS